MAIISPQPIFIWWVIPFALLLIATALMPLVHRQWWEKHYGKVSLGLAAMVGVYYLLWAHSLAPWLHSMMEQSAKNITPAGEWARKRLRFRNNRSHRDGRNP